MSSSNIQPFYTTYFCTEFFINRTYPKRQITVEIYDEITTINAPDRDKASILNSH